MSPENIKMWFDFASHLIGVVVSIAVFAKLTNYRLKRLEDEVHMHNDFARRMPVLEEKIKVCNHRIADLEEKKNED